MGAAPANAGRSGDRTPRPAAAGGGFLNRSGVQNIFRFRPAIRHDGAGRRAMGEPFHQGGFQLLIDLSGAGDIGLVILDRDGGVPKFGQFAQAGAVDLVEDRFRP